jgi:tetratricopeptide (TPR) repeat protein
LNVLRSLALGTAAVSLSATAWAGEEVLYAPPPAWVEPMPAPAPDIEPGKPLRLFFNQVHLSGGTATEYRKIVFALNTPEYLTQLGTVSAQWLPDKGDLIVHEVSIHRDGRVIDVLANGARFDVLRREAGLEQRMLDGVRTATLPVPGTQVGDELHVAFTTTKQDQALGDEVEWTGFLFADPIPWVDGELRVTWDEGSDILSGFTRFDTDSPHYRRLGTTGFSVDLPIAKLEETPGDAPVRFGVPPLAQASSFADYAEVSAVMAPHFATEGTIEADSPLAGEVGRIMAAHASPEARMAAATKLVQDEISYLHNGLNGGNYLPQSPAETWETRFGDCKAKSLLLLALLREMGIEAEAVLVLSEGGDILPTLLPAPGNFNHMIVRAKVGEATYWLDGTAYGTRLANIGDVPRFYHALPLTPNGSDLVPMPLRPFAEPFQTLSITLDQSAGVAVPALASFEVRATGPLVPFYRMIADMEEGEHKDEAFRSAAASALGDVRVYDMSLTFDDDQAVASLTGRALMTSPWEESDGRYRLAVPYQPAAAFGFDGDRARAEWHDIPVLINGPDYYRLVLDLMLPEGGEGFRLMGQPAFDERIGGNRLWSDGALNGGRLSLDQSVMNEAWELPAAELSEVKRANARLQRLLPRVIAPTNARRAWQYGPADAHLLRPIEDAYAALIAEAEEDDADNYLNRAAFHAGVGNWEDARADLDIVIEREASSTAYARRGYALMQLGRLEEALADMRRVEEIEGDGGTFETQIELLALLDRPDEALALADEYALFAADPDEADRLRAVALGHAGQHEQGRALLGELVERLPNAPWALNQTCWYSGIWDVAVAETLDICERAVELADHPAAAIDSRALAQYRLGEVDEALADLDRALAGNPNIHASRYLRGLIRTRAGIPGGSQDIADALRAAPAMAIQYAAYGFPDPR